MRILYLHGFLSSAQSLKALQTRAFVEKYYPASSLDCPQLSAHPQTAWAQLNELGERPYSAVMGSSMGGFLATHLAQRKHIPAICINPVAHPHQLIDAYRGQHINPYTGELISIGQAEVEFLAQIDIGQLTAAELLQVHLNLGDEVIDVHSTQTLYADSHLHTYAGGDHAFSNYAAILPQALDFLFTHSGNCQ